MSSIVVSISVLIPSNGMFKKNRVILLGGCLTCEELVGVILTGDDGMGN